MAISHQIPDGLGLQRQWQQAQGLDRIFNWV